MDERVARLATPEECEQFALNVQTRLPDLARDARRRSVSLRAAAHGAKAAVEREALEAVYAYERVLSAKAGKKIRASRTWQMIKRLGIIEAVERAVNREQDTIGYTALVEFGMEDFAFEAVVKRYPDVFSEDAVARSIARLNAMGSSVSRLQSVELEKTKLQSARAETAKVLDKIQLNSVHLPPGCPTTTELLREDRDR